MIENNYYINPNLMHMAGFYDRNEKACTLVKEAERMFVVEKSPLDLLAFSLKWVGFERKDDSVPKKSAPADKNPQPPATDSLLNLVVIQAQSDTIWLNPEQIHRIRRSNCIKNKTTIIFKNGDTLTIAAGLSADSEKLQNAKPEHKMGSKAVQKSFSFIFDPKNKLFLIFIFAYQLLTGDFGYDFSC